MDDLNLGATGDFPLGKLNKDDEGGLRMAIGTEHNKVIIHFGTPVGWLGLDKHTAIAFGSSIIDKAESLKG